MDDLAPKLSKNQDEDEHEHELKIDPHFEMLKGKMCSEALDILASIIAEYLNEEENE